MRDRVYDSPGLRRDDDDPFAPNELASRSGTGAIDWELASHALLPLRIRALAIDVTVTALRETYRPSQPVEFAVSLRNRLPVPVVLPTIAPILWTWAVDGRERPAEVPADGLRSRDGAFTFARRERKVFRRRWWQRFRQPDGSWSRASPGTHTISVQVLAKGTRDLEAETTVRIKSA